MIRFQYTPDKVFQALLQNALELARDMVAEEEEDEDLKWLEISSSLMDKQVLLAQLDKLMAAHQSQETFMPTDYHFLILFEALGAFCDLVNDDIQDGAITQFADIKIAGIRFGALLDEYFWDTDFLMDPEDFNALNEEQKAALDFSQETFGIINSLAPHPDELLLKPGSPQPPHDTLLYEDGKMYPCD